MFKIQIKTTERIKFVITTALTFLLIFPILSKKEYYSLNSSYIAVVIMMILLIVTFIRQKIVYVDYVKKLFFKEFDFLTLFILYTIFIVIIFLYQNTYNTNDKEFFNYYMHFFIYLVKSIFIPLFFYKIFLGKKATFENYVLILLVCSFLLFITSVFLIAFSSIKVWWIQDVIEGSAEHLKSFNQFYFRIAITGLVGDSTARVTGIYLILGSYIISTKNLSKIKMAVFMFLEIVVSIATAFYARTGILAVLVAFFIFAIYKRNLFVRFIILVFLVFFAILLLAQLNSGLNRIVQWAFELFSKLFSSGNISTSSTDALLSTYHIPSLDILLGGTGQYQRSLLFEHGDSGIIRKLYYFGIPGLIMDYSLLFGFYLLTKKKFIANKDHQGVLMSKLLFILAIAWEFKIPSIVAYIDGFVLINALLFIDSLNQEKKEINTLTLGEKNGFIFSRQK